MHVFNAFLLNESRIAGLPTDHANGSTIAVARQLNRVIPDFPSGRICLPTRNMSKSEAVHGFAPFPALGLSKLLRVSSAFP